MQAIIFADRHGEELAPLNEEYCPALLPLANRPLLEYTLDDLADAQVDEVLIVVSHQADQIEEHFGNGEMWGMRFRYLLSRGEEVPEQIIQRYAPLLEPVFLALRGDMLRPKLCHNFIKTSHGLYGDVVEAGINGCSAGMYLVRKSDSDLPGLAWPLQTDCDIAEQNISYTGGPFSRLHSLAEFHQSAMDLLKNSLSSATLIGRKVDDEMTVGRLTQVKPSSHDGGNLLIGDHAKVDANSQLAGPLIIGHRCIIDRDAKLSNSIVMPGTYVGKGLEVENAILLGHHLIRVDLDSHIPVDDPLLLTNVDHEISTLLATLPERLLGMSLLLLSLPLWPLAFLVTLWRSPKQVFLHKSIISNLCKTSSNTNQCAVNSWQFATTIPVLRNLPMLWLVIRGDLRLFGCEPLSPEIKTLSYPYWDAREERGNAGLLGPAQLELPTDAPEEEIRLNEAVFVQQNGVVALCHRLFNALVLFFSPRAWRTTKQSV